MHKLKVAIAGFGIVGRRRFQYIKEHPSLEVTAICEQRPLEKNIEYSGINYYNNYKELLEKENLDIIFVCLTNNIAAEVTINSLKKGLHVFCEKPPSIRTFNWPSFMIIYLFVNII